MKAISRSRLCYLILFFAVFCLAAPQLTYAANDTKKAKATNVQYVTDSSGKKVGIKSFMISPYTYNNLSQDTTINPGGDATLQLNDAMLLKIAKNQIFPRWGVIAEGIFRDQANQLVTIEGSGMMSSDTGAANSFDRQFSKGKVSNGYNYDWAVDDLAKSLSQPVSSHKGKTCWDETRITGITQIGSLDGARTLMGQELRNCSDDNDISKDEFLGNNHQKNEDKRRLPDLEDTKSGDGFVNIVTCVNRAGASGDYDYVTFGLAVYDFDITPVAAQNLKYIEAADDDYDVDGQTKSGQDILMGLSGDNVEKNGISFHNDNENGTTSYLRNNTTQEVTQSSGLENSVTEESTLSTDDTFEWGMEQEIGLELNFGGFGPGSVIEGAAAPCMFPRATVNISNSWHELWSTTQSKSETNSATKTKTTNTEVTLPAHTIAVVNQSLNNKKTTENYQQPVVLSYKVAIFAMSGDYFNGWGGGIENSRYDKQWMSVIFDGSDDYITSGCKGLGSLYNRGVVNADTQGYDGAKGKYNVWCDKGGWSKSSKINWNNISTAIQGDSRASHRIELGSGKKATTVKDLATELPLLEKAQLLTSKRESITSSVDQIVPLYPLDSVTMKSGTKKYELVPRGQQTDTQSDKLYLDTIDLEGFDKDGAEFFGFDDNWGEWKLLDENGNVIEDGSPKDESDTEGQVKSGLVTIVTDDDLGSQWVQISRGGQGGVETHNLKWKIKKGDEAKIVSNETLITDDPYMSDEDKDKVDTPTIAVTVKDRESDITNFEVGGTYKGPWNQEINLAHYLTADAIDTTTKIRGVAIYWESNGAAGITVDESGKTTFTRRGTYKVRPYAYNMDDAKIIPKDADGKPVWLEVTAQDKASLTNIVMNKPDLDEDDSTLTQGTTSLGFDLASYTKFFDQYGDKWEGTEEDPLPTVKYSVSPGDYADIDNEDILTVTRAGTYTVSAKAYDKNGNDTGISIKPIKIVVSEEDYLSTILFDEPAMSRAELTLKDKDGCVVVPNLKGLLTYLDQHDEEWTGKKPNVTFSVPGDPKDAEIKGGNFYAYGPGTYIIEASASGYDIQPITVVIEEDAHLSLKAEDPGKQYLYTEGDQIDLELERYINATTKFGGKWKGVVPAMKFTLKEGTTGAEIETRTVYGGEDDYVGEDKHFFKSSTPGEYTVHVEPLKASEYSEPLDDMHIKVVKGKKIARIEFREFNDEADDKEIMVSRYNSTYPKVELNKYLNYYDGFGELIDPEKDHVRIPDCKYELVSPEDYEEGSCDLDRNILTAYEGQSYFIKATMNVTNYDPYGEEEGDTILEAIGTFDFYDIDWLHTFGEWETTKEPTCSEEGIRVKRCTCGEDCINHEEGECNVTIEDTIPATGHAWDKYYSIDKTNHILYTTCEMCGEVNEASKTSYPKYYLPDNGYITINGESRPNSRYNSATCSGTGVYGMQYSMYPYTHTKVTVPAIGHKWSKEFKVIKEATCSEEGVEAIVCERKNYISGHFEPCGEIREGAEYRRTIPKKEHEPDEDAWKYEVDEEGNELRETCEDYGWKVTKCKGCGKPMFKLIDPTGHNWGEGEVQTAPTCTAEGVRKYTCANDDSHTKTEPIPATGHDLKEIARVEATCEEAGHEAYWKCSNDNCGKMFSDKDGQEEIEEPIEIQATGHAWDDGEVTIRPSYEHAGEKTYKCIACAATKTEEISNDKEKDDYDNALAKLKDDITAAEKAEEGVDTSEDGKDVATSSNWVTPTVKSSMDEAIAAAKTIADKEKPTKEEVDKAIEDLAAAVVNFNNAKKAGTKINYAPGEDPNQKGNDGTAVGKGASAVAADKAISSATSDEGPKGTKFSVLRLKSTKQSNKSITLTWTKAKGAVKYVVYGNAYGKKYKMKKLKTLGNKNSFTVKKISKTLKKATYHKLLVVALDKNNNVVSTSKVIHVATRGGKVTNPKKVTVKKGKKNVGTVTVKKGKTVKVKSTVTKIAKKLTLKKRRVVMYESSNTKIAKVGAKNGKITGVAKGTCAVYAYTQSGVFKKITVKVR